MNNAVVAGDGKAFSIKKSLEKRNYGSEEANHSQVFNDSFDYFSLRKQVVGAEKYYTRLFCRALGRVAINFLQQIARLQRSG